MTAYQPDGQPAWWEDACPGLQVGSWVVIRRLGVEHVGLVVYCQPDWLECWRVQFWLGSCWHYAWPLPHGGELGASEIVRYATPDEVAKACMLDGWDA